jgi:hypothetical protein
MPADRHPDDAFDSSSIDIIDLTGDDLEDDGNLVAQQRAYRRQQQEKMDRDMAISLSQEQTRPSQSAIPPRQNAFTKLMQSQPPRAATAPGHAGPSTGFASAPKTELGALPRRTSPHLPMPGAWNGDWDSVDPFMSHSPGLSTNPAHRTMQTHQAHPASSPGLPHSTMQLVQRPTGNQEELFRTAFSSPAPGSHANHMQLHGPWAGHQNPPYRVNAFEGNASISQGFTNGTGLQPWSASGHSSVNGIGLPSYPPSGQPSANRPSLMSIIDRTSMFNYATGTDAEGDPLSDRLASYIQDAYHDPRVTEKELDELLQNIRPDLDISEKNRDGTPAGLKNTLYPHQELALTWMKKMEDGSNKGGILADDMGLGKTISTLALILERPATVRPKTNLIIGPLSLIRQWEEEIRTKTKLSHRLSTFIYHNKKATTDDLLGYDVVLTTYGTIAAELKRLEKHMMENADRNIDYNDKTLAVKCPLLHPKKAVFYRVILDEAQCIKNKNTQTAKACYKLRATYRWCLTGTPMMNGVLEMYSLLHFLRSKPYGNWDRFRDVSQTAPHSLPAVQTSS